MDDGEQLFIHTELLQFYYALGHLDRLFEIILSMDLTSSTWSDADIVMFRSTVVRAHGFTAHPDYLVAAERLGIVSVWERRGPPDFCDKIDGKWVCQ